MFRVHKKYGMHLVVFGN